MKKCNCGQGSSYATCCEPLHSNVRNAQTAEELMRSRYCAYTLGNVEYIINTTASEKRDDCNPESIKNWSESVQWENLEIINTKNGQEHDTEGEVEFIAHFSEDNQHEEHHELSTFKKEGDAWFYVDGKIFRKPIRSEKIGRNQPCPCGSNKKYKKCCGK